jgi:hypothetical protein
MKLALSWDIQELIEDLDAPEGVASQFQPTVLMIVTQPPTPFLNDQEEDSDIQDDEDLEFNTSVPPIRHKYRVAWLYPEERVDVDYLQNLFGDEVTTEDPWETDCQKTLPGTYVVITMKE